MKFPINIGVVHKNGDYGRVILHSSDTEGLVLVFFDTGIAEWCSVDDISVYETRKMTLEKLEQILGFRVEIIP